MVAQSPNVQANTFDGSSIFSGVYSRMSHTVRPLHRLYIHTCWFGGRIDERSGFTIARCVQKRVGAIGMVKRSIVPSFRSMHFFFLRIVFLM